MRDAHTHLAAGASDLLDLDLRDATSVEELTRRLQASASRLAPNAWIRGFGWDGTSDPADAAGRNPVFLARRDGHAAFVNREARRALGLDARRSVVSEAAFEAARALLPERSTDERIAALQPRLRELFAFGIDTVDDMVEPWAPHIYARLRDARELPVAVGMWLPESIDAFEAEALRREFPRDDRTLAVRGVKLFLDGTLSARTAALSASYADDPETRGPLRMEERELNDRVRRWAERGFAVAVHAIGDRAVSLALDALERAPLPASGSHRIEHAQVVLRTDLARFAAGGIVASVQPGHFRDDASWLAARLGERPQVVIHPLRSLAVSGAKLLFGSDWPVSAWDPAWVLAAATDPRRGDEALDAASALAWYTSGPR